MAKLPDSWEEVGRERKHPLPIPSLPRPHFKGAATVIWALVVVAVILWGLFMTYRPGRVTGEEVGILLNKLTGETTVIAEAGVRWYCGFTTRFYVLDRTLQTLEMTYVESRGDRQGHDDIKVKTVDGSDVYVDIIVQYRLDPENADLVLETSGADDAFKEKWARDYVRAHVRNFLGELTTEDFYDSDRRNIKLAEALEATRDSLSRFGLLLDSVVMPTRPRFYAEYEDMIKKKKLADQQALEEASKADAAKQKQLTEIVQATNKKNVAVEEYKGKMEQLVIEAGAEAEKTRKAADAYYDRVTIGAEAGLYESEQNAEGILAEKEAEAQGIEALKEALEGEGGRNMVKMEYAKRLKDVVITGQPYMTSSETRRLEHTSAPAGSAPSRIPERARNSAGEPDAGGGR